MIKAVFFDLDDTLFDHQYARRSALDALRKQYSTLARVSLENLETKHEQLLTANYDQVLKGSLSMGDAVQDRIRALCVTFDLILDEEEAKSACTLYRSTYAANQRAIPGSIQLLQQLKGRVITGLITNGLIQVQTEKISLCRLEILLDHIIISEAVGYKKPDPRIFIEALLRAKISPAETLYIGDSWKNDIIAAHDCGLHTLWLNRYGINCPDTSIAMEIPSYLNLDIDRLLKKVS